MTKNFCVKVQKYGGSSVATPEKIKQVAKYIKSQLQDDQRICVVVSAMGHTTNELLSLAHQICQNPPKRELDMLLSCGERASMALLAMALQEISIKAISLTGSQSGIITDDKHSQAQIKAIKPNRVLEAFIDHHVVIVAGFQGVSEGKEITTLRRGGSDTTAVAMAAALNAEICEIYTDVPGVMDIDPKIIESAQLLSTISYEQMESMALYGAKILAHDAIRLAKEHNIAIRIAKTADAVTGTRVVNAVNLLLDPVLTFTHLRGLLRISLDGNDFYNITNASGYFLCGSWRNDSFVGYMSNDIAQELISLPTSIVESGLALITIHLPKNQMALPTLVCINKIFKEQDFFLKEMLVGHNEIFLIVADDNLQEILKAVRFTLLRGVSS
jgi:aspartokinase